MQHACTFRSCKKTKSPVVFVVDDETVPEVSEMEYLSSSETPIEVEGHEIVMEMCGDPEITEVSGEQSDCNSISGDEEERGDDVLLELEGRELQESLRARVEAQIEMLEQVNHSKITCTVNDYLTREITMPAWEKAKSNHSLG